MADIIRAFLRRNNISAGRLEYLFFTAETYDLGGDDKIIDPVLPGTDATNIKGGTGSPNFIFDIGIKSISLRVLGTLVGLAANNYPTLSGTDRYITESSIVASAAAQTAEQVRESLLDFWANQSNTSYSDFSLGWLSWGAGDDTTIAGSAYRVWEGIMRQPKTMEDAGVPSQFHFSFNFKVGDS